MEAFLSRSEDANMALVRIIFIACDAAAKRDGFVQAERHQFLKRSFGRLILREEAGRCV
jgi:hypothetical protein